MSPSAAEIRSTEIRILHVEDNTDFAEVVSLFLEQEDERFDIETATNAAEAYDRLTAADFDCIVSDHDMPGETGIELLERVRESHPDLPFVLFTGKGSEEVASKAIARGVSDYLQKETGTDQYSVLANRITNLVAQYQAESAVEKRVRQQRITAELGQTALETDDLQTVFDAAVQGLSRGLDTEYTKVLEYRPAHEDVLLRAGVGWEAGLVGEASVGIGSDSQAGYTLHSEEPVIVTDLTAEERFSGPPLLSDHGVVSGISVVIGSRDDPWGILGAHTTEQTVFTDDDVNFVQSVANILATTVARSVTNAPDRQRRILFEQSPDMIDVLDSEGRILDANRSFCEELGHDRAELIGRPIWELDQLVDADDVGELLSDFAPDERRKFEGLYERSDGSTVPVEVHLLRLSIEGEDRFLAISRDITEKLESLTQFQGFLAASPDAVLIVGEDGTIEAANQKVSEVLGFTPTALEGMVVEELIFEEDRSSHVDSRQEYMQSPEPRPMGRDLDLYARHKDGTRVPVEISLGPIRHEGETSVVVTISDISERKRREQKLERQNSALEEFADVVAHDIRGPLSTINGRLKLARMECDSVHLDAAEEAVRSIETLVDEVLSLAREGAVVETVDQVEFPTVVEACWQTAETGTVQLVNEAEGAVRADTNRLHQLLQNLFRNAAEHTTGDATVRVGMLDDGFFVEDDGNGIPAEHRDQVLQWGYSTAPSGTGFGLAIVDRIVKAHDWTLRLTEGTGGGARFEITGVEFVDT